MTVTVPLSGEKPTPESPVIIGTVNRGYNHSYFKSKCGKLKVAQIVLGLLALLFLIQSYRVSYLEYVFLFLTFNASVLTTIVLWDKLKGERLRALFQWDITVEARYNATMALLYYTVSFFELGCNIWFYFYETKSLAAVAGVLASIAYARNWWLLYREMHSERIIATKVEEFNREKDRGAVMNV